MQILLSSSQPSFKYIHVLKIMLQVSKERIYFLCKTLIILWAQVIKFLQIFLINSTIFQLLIKMGKLSLLRNLILLFFSKPYFRKYLPGSGQFKFEFSKDFSRFTLLGGRWTESIHDKYLKLKRKKKSHRRLQSSRMCVWKLEHLFWHNRLLKET